MDVFSVFVVLALHGCGRVLSVTYSELTVPGPVGSEDVIYRVYELTATYQYSDSIPTIDEFKHIDEMGTTPTFLENNSTGQLYCFGFYSDSCLMNHTDTNAYYHQHSVGSKQRVSTINLAVDSTGEFRGIVLWYADLSADLLDVANGGRNAGQGYAITVLEAGYYIFVGVVYDQNKLKFLFSRNTWNSPGNYYYHNIYADIISTVQSNIGDLENFKQKYTKNPMKEVAEKGCALYRDVYGQSYASTLLPCLYSYMMQYIVTMGDNIDHLKAHEPRNLLNTSDHSTAAYAAQVADAIAFRTVINAVQINNNQTVQLASALGSYFKTTASFDRNIAVQDSGFLKLELQRLENGTRHVVSEVTTRLRRLLKNAIILNGLQIIDLEIQLAIAVAENMNPLKHIFGGTDLSAIYQLATDIAAAAASYARVVRLSDHMKEYADTANALSRNFRSNKLNIAQLDRIIALSDDADSQELKDFAANYVSKYGAYTPSVTSQDLASMGGKLATVVDHACELFYEPEGLVTSTTQLILDQEDCVYLPALVDSLMSYYDETFQFQFALIDAFTNIVRGAIAESLAGAFETSEGQSEIDIKIAGLGTAMLEVRLHEIVRKHCDWLEYRFGGKRISECNASFFDESIINGILRKDEGDIEKNSVIKYAFIPTEKPAHADERGYPYINLTELITTGEARFQLPMGEEYDDFLIDYGWLPGEFRSDPDYNKETSYFINMTEAYIPGLQCSDTSDPDKSYLAISMISGEPNPLFPETAPPQFVLPSAKFHFRYNKYNPSHGCAGDTHDYRVKLNNQISVDWLCVLSPGNYHGTGDKLIPSMYAPWTMIISKHEDCVLVHPKETLGSNPMVTFRVQFKEVRMTGIDECWPSGGTRCPGQTCSDGMLTYSCN